MGTESKKSDVTQEILALVLLGAVLILAVIGYAIWWETGEDVRGVVVEHQTSQSLTGEDDKATYYVVLQKEDGSREKFKVTQSVYRQTDKGEVCTFSTRGWASISARKMSKPSCR